MMRETWALLAIRAVDLLMTIALLRAGIALEGNPLAARLLALGPIAFFTLGLALLFLPILLLEWCARRSERARRFTVCLMRLGIGFYLGWHVGSIVLQYQIIGGP